MTELAMLASTCTPPSAIQIKYPAENKIVHEELNANNINLDKREQSGCRPQEAGSQRMVSATGPRPIFIARGYEKRGQTNFSHRDTSH
jgi:hypothetical protein